MQRIKSYIETSLCIYFNRVWLSPDEAGSAVAQITIEACKDIYPDSSNGNGTMRRIQKDWLTKYYRSYAEKIKSYLEAE